MRRIAILTDSPTKYSETFVRSHIEHLQGDLHLLYGGHLPTLFGNGQHLLSPRLIKRAGYHLCHAVFGRSPRYFTAAGAFEAYIRRHHIEAVIAEFGTIGAAVMESCARIKVPLIVHFRGSDAYTYREPGWAPLGLVERYPILVRTAAAIVAVSRQIRANLIELGADPERVFYNPSGANIEVFDHAMPHEAPPLFVAVGRFVEKKAPHLTILAFRELVTEIPEARMVMVGNGPLLGPCVGLAKSLSLSGHIEFRGVQSQQEVAQLFREARAFVQHSVQAINNDSEGTPVAIMEAQSSGLPVVATRHAGIMDVVVEGETGFLVDEYDVSAMAEGMVHLAVDAPLARRLGSAGRDRVRAQFSMQGSVARLSKIIDDVIGNHPRDPGAI